MHAAAAQQLLDRLAGRASATVKILDVGSGSGYLTAVLALSVPFSFTLGIDVIPELVAWSKKNFGKDAVTRKLLESGRVMLRPGDGWRGVPEAGPFDLIHVGAAAEEVPAALVEQLALGGRMVCPVGIWRQQLVQIDKAFDGKLTRTDLMAVVYVPLVAAPKEV